jgi:hypothetical protein
VCTFFIRDLQYAIGVWQQVLPVSINGHLGLKIQTGRKEKGTVSTTIIIATVRQPQ